MEHDATMIPIAIIGMSTLLPDAVDTGSFWRNILAGHDCMRDVPSSHWLIEDYYDPNAATPDKTYAKRGAFLPDVPFDPLAFGIPPNMLPSTDTAQLLALLVAKRVLDDASRGQFDKMNPERISVILGATGAQELMVEMGARLQRPVWAQALRELDYNDDEVNEVCTRISSLYVPFVESTFPGLLGNVIAGRIANRFNLGGTNCVTDAACASALAALSMGLQELALGHSDVVITGGVDTMNDPSMFMCFSKTPALSATGDCRPFSAEADGTMLGEGLVMFALKRLADAERDNDRIYAVIRGIGTSSDGRALSVYAPRPEGQAKALRRAYEAAGYGPNTVELVEAHGTGTKAGDAAEFTALARVFNEADRADRQWCALGSVKSQIGHTKSTAGAAGMAKAVLALQHKVLPPTIKVTKPNPQLEIEKSAFYVNTEARPWIRANEHPRRASVSAFGFGGSNFHVTLEEYTGGGERAPRIWTSPTELVLLGAETSSALAASCRQNAAALTDDTHLNTFARRTQHGFSAKSPARLAVVATDMPDLRRKLEQAAKNLEQSPDTAWTSPTGIYIGFKESQGSTAFLFPGQGSQYVGMGADVAKAFDPARSAWDAAASISLANDTRLHEVVFPRPVFDAEARTNDVSRLTATEWAQPAIGTSSVALLQVLRALQFDADVLGGHSFGELSALHAAGAIEMDAFLLAARKRGELMRDAATTPGAMIAVARPVKEVLAALEEANITVGIANDNGPKQTVLSDTVSAITSAETILRAKGFDVRRLSVATAFHSPVVGVARDPFRSFLGTIAMRAPQKPVYSNVDAAPHPDAVDAIHERLADQIVSRVRFAEMIEKMYAAGVRTFVEVGPGSVLTNLVEQILDTRATSATIVNLDRKGQHGITALWQALGRLAAAGHTFNFDALWTGYALESERPVPRPKFAVDINGANYGRPYPERKLDASKRPVSPVRQKPAIPAMTSPKDAPKPVAPPAPTPPPSAITTMPTPVRNPVTMTQPVSTPLPATRPVMALNVNNQMLTSLGDAHAAMQRALSDGHSNYLRAMESSFASLCAVMGAPQSVPALAPAPFNTRSLPAPIEHAPPIAAPPIAAPLPPPVMVSPPPAPMPIAVAPAPKPMTPASPMTQGPDIHATLIDIVAEKTGYPKEMLEPTMSLEGDLGIDSIKRVEILSGLRDRLPNLPPLEPSQMASLRTLGQIIDHLRESAGGSATPITTPITTPAPAALPTVDLAAVLTSIVAEKTGYPKEMLEPGMSLEGDLGIDSIKRVEILSGLRDRLPQLPPLEPSQMASLRTLGQIIDHLRESAGGSAAPIATPAASPAIDLDGVLLSIVAEKTGYPKEMLEPTMSLEGDLGIDSIKRVEILSGMRDRLPNLPPLEPSQMASLRTLGQIAEHMRSISNSAQPVAAPTVGVQTNKSRETETVARAVVVEVGAKARGISMFAGKKPARVAVTNDGLGVQPLVVERLRNAGFAAYSADSVTADDDAIVFFGGLRTVTSTEDAFAITREAFTIMRTAAPRMTTHGGVFVTVQETGGDFGLSGRAGDRAWLSGLTGLVKTAALEWPNAAVKAIDVERSDRSVETIANAIVHELLEGGTEKEVGLHADGIRTTLAAIPAAASSGSFQLRPKSVIVVSGGARGVTVATLQELARTVNLRIVLLGRTPLEDEPPCVKGVEGDSGIKRALLADAQRRRAQTSPAEIGRLAERVLAMREARAGITSLEKLGSEVRYVAVDVRDQNAVDAALADVRTTWGPIQAIIHAAGVLADKVIAEKTDDQFTRVFDTKVKGLHSLLHATRTDELELLCVFSSVAARTGNIGQSDYSLSNEIVNRVAAAERVRRQGRCVVRTLGWGPWDGGMVTPGLRTHFQARGIPLISLHEGARAFVRELSAGGAGDTEVVLGAFMEADGRSEVGALEREFVVVPTQLPYLESHRIAGKVVLPVVVVLEWFAKAAQEFFPTLDVVRCDDIRVLKGVILKWDERGETLRVVCRSMERTGASLVLSLDLVNEGNVRHYAARVEVAPRPLTAADPGEPIRVNDEGHEKVRATTAYSKVLFHGPHFQALQSLSLASDAGLTGTLHGARELGWPNHSSPQLDAALIDGGLQMAIVWGHDRLGRRTLPTKIGSFRLFQPGLVDGPVFTRLRVDTFDPLRISSTLTWLDTTGKAIAVMDGLEMHVVANESAHS